MQQSTSGRVITMVATSDGNLGFANIGSTTWTLATNTSSTTPPLSATGLHFGASNLGKLWLVDGLNYRVFDPSTGIITDWVANAGVLPRDGNGFGARITETWRGRQVVFGVVGDPYNWFMSRLGDPTDFQYAVASPGPTDPISGETGPQGKVGDIMTGFVPYTDDVAFCGCSHSMYLFNGDPNAGGTLDLISTTIGMAFGRAWCQDPYGNLYFFSNRCGLYTLVPGQQPQRISQAIEQLVFNVNTGVNAVSLTWNDKFQGVNVWISPVTGSAPCQHLFFEQRTNGWWQVEYSNPNHNPMCACSTDGNNPEDRVVIIGSYDGVVRFLDPNAQNDDGRIIESEVIIGPFLDGTKNITLKEIQMILGNDSGEVTYSVYAGDTAESALGSPPVVTGTWEAARNATNLIRAQGNAIYIGVSSIEQWRMEMIRAVIRMNGKIRERSKA